MPSGFPNFRHIPKTNAVSTSTSMNNTTSSSAASISSVTPLKGGDVTNVEKDAREQTLWSVMTRGFNKVE